VLAGGAAAKVHAGKKDIGTVEALFVEWVVGPLPGGGVEADIVESKLAEAIKGDALHEAGRDDAVGVDIRARDMDGGSGDGGDFREGHVLFSVCWGDEKAQATAMSDSPTSNTSRASETTPLTAAAQTITGDIRMVLPKGDPCLPLKFLFEEEAQT